MLRVAQRYSGAAKRAATQTPRRFAHGVSYGPEEPIGYYVKWAAAIGGFTGLVLFDRFYSDGAISKLVTPHTDSEEIERNRQLYADRVEKEQARNVELLFPRERTTHLTNFSAHPVPVGSYRASYTNAVLDQESLGERRPRSER